AGLSIILTKFTCLSGDDFVLWSDADVTNYSYYTNHLQSNATAKAGSEIWNECYRRIFICNSAIDGLSTSTSLSPSVKKQLLGEAYFMRAFFFHFLAGLYGELPLAESTDAEVNRQLNRRPLNEVYSFIIADLLKAQGYLSDKYIDGSIRPYQNAPERTRPTYWAAVALLSRVYLYEGDFLNAENAATQLIDNTELFTLAPLMEVFLKNSSEAIWQIQPVEIGWNTREANLFNLKKMPSGFSDDKPMYLSPFILQAFEPGDQRSVSGNWIDNIILNDGIDTFWFPNKYHGDIDENITSPDLMTEYSMVLRLGEQYLIRAEARIKQNNFEGAKSDLDMIRNRAGLLGTAAATPEDLLTAIFQERRVELFSEWSHRWFDLGRSGVIDDIMSTVTPVKGGNWESTDKLYPIPYEDILRNRNLTQNPGYN
ncbi:MAG: RagB/SusD family nutrient uptake outer membrane protein, partial [Chitinophagaceae bacterium]|nr:RagB/SusD family nutrient uptake outer membrane protein [Chitinophagaceae bacterium]